MGYEYNLPKHAIIKADSKQSIDKFELIVANTGQTVYEGSAVYSGLVFFNLFQSSTDLTDGLSSVQGVRITTAETRH
ncbi:hypothetical protein BW716_10290 [[Flexibacter] sp. ATCC 35208]|nr:hypothetical protein BW716_10290 [[Flexibacter] sp. ATCC 35208]